MLDVLTILASVPAPAPSSAPVWYGVGTLGGGGFIALVFLTLGNAALKEWKSAREDAIAERQREREAEAAEAKEARELKERLARANLDNQIEQRKVDAAHQQALLEEVANIAKVNKDTAQFQAETAVHHRELVREMRAFAEFVSTQTKEKESP